MKVTADLLQEISGIVGYDGEDPSELVAAVRKRVLTCEDCGAADDTARRIKDVIGYAGEDADGLVEAVRALIVTPGAVPDCSDYTILRDDLMRACGMDKTQRDLTTEWPLVSLAAIQTIAELINRHVDMMAMLTEECIDSANLRNEIARLNGQTHSESAEVTALRMNLTLAEHSRDKWESRAVQAESNVETLESELRNREDAPTAPCASTTYLLDISLRALRGEGPDADQLATLIDAARRAA